MNSGRRANRTGRRLESFVQDSLEELGYTETSPQHFFKLRCLKQPIYACQCEIGLDIYSKRRRVDFILYHPEKWDDCLVL